MTPKYFYINTILTLIVSILTASSVNATTTPTFPTCLNPQGELKVQHLNGTHGVPGDTNAYKGHDSVYQLTEETLTQCLCPTDGNGIQTNWWNIKDVEEDEIDSLVAQGWIFVPNGLPWGLDDSPYLAKNSSYSCIGGSGGGSNNSSHSSSSSSRSSNSSSSSHNSDSSTSGDILALASTGNVATIYLYFTIGISLLISGIYIRRVHLAEHE